MQGVGNGAGFFVSYSLPLVWKQIFAFSLDLVKLTDVSQGLRRQMAIIGLVLVIELASSMGQATDFGDAVAAASLETRVIAADRLVLPVSPKNVRACSPARVGEKS
jgi:hypothetical protein